MRRAPAAAGLLLASALLPACDARIEPRYATPTPAASHEATPTPMPPGLFSLRIGYRLAPILDSYPVAVWIEKGDPAFSFVRTLEVFEGGGQQRSALLPQWWNQQQDAVGAPAAPARPPGSYVLEWNGRDWRGAALPTGATYRVLLETSNWGLPETDNWAQVDVAVPAPGAARTPVLDRTVYFPEIRVEVLP